MQTASVEPVQEATEELEAPVKTEREHIEPTEEPAWDPQSAEEITSPNVEEVAPEVHAQTERASLIAEPLWTAGNISEPAANEETSPTAELKTEETADEPVEPIVSMRRMSARLSAVHLKRAMTPQKPTVPKTPSTLRNSCGKENAKPKLFNKNISHIPTLKERVSMLASKPVANKRPKPEVSVKVVKKPKFNLKESLSRPLSYKPYTGAIKKTHP